MYIKMQKFSFDEFKKSEIFKKWQEYEAQEYNPYPYDKIEHVELTDEEVEFALDYICSMFR